MKNFVIFILVVGFIFSFVYSQDLESPNLAFPRENEVIYSGNLFIFAEPHPKQVDDRYLIHYEISRRDTGKMIHQGKLTPESGYETYLQIVKWKNGDYLLKIFYVDPKTRVESPASWRSFTIENN